MRRFAIARLDAHVLRATRADHERVYHKPERQADLRTMETWLPRAVSLAAACSRWPAAPAGERRSAHAMRATGWPPTLNPETMAVAQSKTCRRACASMSMPRRWRDSRAALHEAFAGFWRSPCAAGTLIRVARTLHARLEPGARVVMLANRFVAGSSTPISAPATMLATRISMRALDEGSRCTRCSKNFPARDDALQRSARARCELQWIEHLALMDPRVTLS